MIAHRSDPSLTFDRGQLVREYAPDQPIDERRILDAPNSVIDAAPR